jgi:shikimate kinase
VDVRHIVVLGLMGAGKTAVGQVLARRLGWHLSDSDEEIRARTGKTVRELRAEKGVDAMHRLEYEHLLTALEVDQTTIVCGAASVVEDAGCRARGDARYPREAVLVRRSPPGVWRRSRNIPQRAAGASRASLSGRLSDSDRC